MGLDESQLDALHHLGAPGAGSCTFAYFFERFELPAPGAPKQRNASSWLTSSLMYNLILKRSY